MPKLDKWIGLDWDEISITSDASQNRKDLMNGVTERHLACSICSKKFRNHMELVACELSHQSENPFKCPHRFCTSRYHKASELKSHMRKRHQKHWSRFEHAMLKSIVSDKVDEVALLLQPSDAMLEAMDPMQMLD